MKLFAPLVALALPTVAPAVCPTAEDLDTVGTGQRFGAATGDPDGDVVGQQLADDAQRGTIGMCRVQFDRERRNPGLFEIRIGAADSQHFAIPQRLARQWRGRRVEYRKLDAG